MVTLLGMVTQLGMVSLLGMVTLYQVGVANLPVLLDSLSGDIVLW